jgi:hypothetical protein
VVSSCNLTLWQQGMGHDTGYMEIFLPLPLPSTYIRLGCFLAYLLRSSNRCAGGFLHLQHMHRLRFRNKYSRRLPWCSLPHRKMNAVSKKRPYRSVSGGRHDRSSCIALHAKLPHFKKQKQLRGNNLLQSPSPLSCHQLSI